ncbi:hypothetical protein FGIG_07192, partial [Fasciola gigantica]
VYYFFSDQFVPTLHEYTDNAAVLPCDARGRGGIRSFEETLAELRRENFRLRLLCYNYEQVYKRSTNPQDFESSRLFAAEAENLSLKESIAEKHGLLMAASKMIDVLKEENDTFEQQLRDLKKRFEANEEEWRRKYDVLYQELEQSKNLIRTQELQLMTQENEKMRQENKSHSRIAELEVHLQSTKAELGRKQRELDSFQQEAEKLRSSLEQFEKEQPRIADSQAAALQLCDCMSVSCQQRLDELASIVRTLRKQLTDAGLDPQVNLPVDQTDDLSTMKQTSSRNPLSPISSNAEKNLSAQHAGSDDDHSDDPSVRIAYLSQRLDSARQLLLEIGNEKLRQDKLISRLQATNDREQHTLNEQCRSLREQLEKQKQLHSVELVRRDDEIQRLHQRVTELVGEIDNLMAARGSLMSEVDKSRERISRLQWEHAEVCERMNKELREKQRVIQQLQIALTTVETRDVTQFSLPDDAHLIDISSAPDGPAGDKGGSREPESKDHGPGDDDIFLRHQFLSVSRHGQEPYPPVTSPAEDNVANGSPEQVAILSEVHVGNLSGKNRRSHGTETYTLDVKQSTGVENNSRTSKTDSTLEDTNTVSLASENISSFDVTKEIAQLSSCLSAADSFANLPTVSTPPRIPDSPDYNAIRVNPPVVSRYSPITNSDVSSHSSSELPKKAETHQNWSEQSKKNAALQSSGIIHSTTVGPSTPPSPMGMENHSDNKNEADSFLPELAANQPPSSCAIRELYNLIHNLKLQLDNVKFTEHSFVEMVNRSLSTAGINASFQFSPQKTRASLLLKSAQAVTRGGLSLFEPCLLQSSRPSGSQTPEMSKANATYGGADTLFDDLNASPQPTCLADHSVPSTSGLNLTVAELRMCPTSPNVSGLNPKTPSIPDSPRGPTVRPSRLPRAVGKPSNLIGSASICEGITHQFRACLPPLSVSFSAGEGEVWPRHDNAPQHSAMGDLTMVEWQNRDLFERLSQATARLRDALEECAEVGSELWQGDVSQRLLMILSNNHLEDTQSHPDEADKHSTVDEKTPEPVATKPDLDYSLGFMAQNRSVRFDDANPLPVGYDPIAADDSLTQLYGSAWKSCASIASLPEYPEHLSQGPEQHTHRKITGTEVLTSQFETSRPFESSVPSKFVTTSDSSIGKGASAHGLIKTPQFENTIRDTPPTRSKQLGTSVPVRSPSETHESTARYLEELSHLAEQLSNAQDRISCLERERQELLGLLPESATGTSVSELAQAWNRLCEEQVELKSRLAQCVSSENYHQLEQLVGELRSDLSSREQTIGDQQSRLDHFMQQFRAAMEISTPDSDDFMSCVDTFFSKFCATQNAMDTLNRENFDLIRQLEQTVPKTAFEKLQQQFESVQSECESITAQLASSDDRLEQMEQLIFTEFPEQSDRPILTVTEHLVCELRELRDAVDQLTHEQQIAYSLLRDICPIPDPGTLTGFVEAIRESWQSIQHNLTEMTTETNRALDLLRGMNLATVHDPDTLCGYVQACSTCLTEKQDEINRLGLLCEQNEESLRHMVHITHFEKVKLELNRVNEELEETRGELRSVEAQLDDVIRSSVPFETFESKNERVACLEKELDDIQKKQIAYDAERNEIIALINEKTSRSVTAENWVDTIGHICDEFSEITASMNRLHSEYQLVLSECQELREQVSKMIVEVEDNSSQVRREHEAALVALRESLSLDFTKRLEAITEEQSQSTTRLSEQLESTRSQSEQLSEKLTQRESELMEIGNKLHEAEREIAHLRDSIALHIESTKAASDAAKAHERRADQLASHLECLRQEHRKCPAQLELVDAQTSPVAECPTGDDFDAAVTLRPASVELNEARMRKYGELKAVAFEIKEKLVRRTEKLEVALTEVARLRSVIQQDKEHASRILEEVEDLRKQAIRKNKRIHELETELSQLKALRTGSQPASNTRHTRSSARTISEVEQPRGAYCVALSAQISASPALVDDNTASLLQCPDTPFINPTETNTESIPQPDSTSLLCESVASDHAPSSVNKQVPDAVETGERCDRCEKLHGLVLGMRRLTTELQRRVDVDLREEYSLLATLDAFDAQPTHQSSAQNTMDRIVPGLRSLSTSNLVPNASVVGTFQLSVSSSVGDLRTLVKSLHHTRSRLKHYACEMERMCGVVIKRCSSVAAKPTTDGLSRNEDEIRVTTIKRSLELLLRVIRRTKAFFKGLEVSSDITAREVLADLHTVVKTLSMGRDTSVDSSPHPPGTKTDEDKENQPTSESEVRASGVKRRSDPHAKQYYQRYRDLTQGLDTMTKELTETNNVLTAARTSLERTAGVTLLTSRQFSKTWSPTGNADSA